MIYSYGARIDDDSNAITVIDEENRSAETTGYVNGEYVEFSGGGGSSDFSTAEVTLVNNTEHSMQIVMLPVIFESEEITAVLGVYPPYIEPDEDPVTVAVPLYKGMCVWTTAAHAPYSDYNFSGSGDVTVIPEEGLLITGDCTITISNAA